MSLILARRVIQGTLLNGFAVRIGLRTLKNDAKISNSIHLHSCHSQQQRTVQLFSLQQANVIIIIEFPLYKDTR